MLQGLNDGGRVGEEGAQLHTLQLHIQCVVRCAVVQEKARFSSLVVHIIVELFRPLQEDGASRLGFGVRGIFPGKLQTFEAQWLHTLADD